MRTAIYARVSTIKQAESDLSIPDQIKACEDYAAAKGWTVEKTFIDAGASATTDNRPKFQDMITEACSSEKPFDVVVVHSQSRFARNVHDLVHYQGRLERNSVSFISITQDFGDGNEAQMIRTIVGAYDEYASKETAKHVRRSMIENAKAGFWNGSKPPYGFRTYVAEKRGKKDKKKIEIDPEAAEIIRLIFRLYVRGDGTSGPIGTKKVVQYLNSRGYRKAGGQTFSVSFVGSALRNTAYIGKYSFNRKDSRTGKKRPPSDWVSIEIPHIVRDEDFYAAQERLDIAHPMKTAPRITNSKVLLTGIAHCGICDGPMKIQTGKNNRYRYYKCSKCRDQGKAVCKGTVIPESKLDDIVLQSFCDHVLTEERMAEALERLVARTAEQSKGFAGRLRDLSKEKRDIRDQLKNLYDEVGMGLKLDGTLRGHTNKLQERQDQLTKLIASLERQRDLPVRNLTRAQRKAFTGAVRQRLLHPDDPGFRRAYLRQMVARVDVSDSEIRITGPKAALANAAMAENRQGEAVLTFAQEWRAGPDSNPGHAD